MGGRREFSIISDRPVTGGDLKQERSFFRGSVSTFLQLVVARPQYDPSCVRALQNEPGAYMFREQNPSCVSAFTTSNS